MKYQMVVYSLIDGNARVGMGVSQCNPKEENKVNCMSEKAQLYSVIIKSEDKELAINKGKELIKNFLGEKK